MTDMASCLTCGTRGPHTCPEPTGAQADEPSDYDHTALVHWLRRQYMRSREIEDKLAADMLEQLQRALEAAIAKAKGWEEDARGMKVRWDLACNDIGERDETIDSLRAQLASAANELLAAETELSLATAGTRSLWKDRCGELTAQLASAEAELGNIAHAKRFDRAVFWSDTEFADWAQSRCHAALTSDAVANKEREP